MIDQSSDRRFSTGVPVRAILCLALSVFMAWVCFAASFLMFCASSMTTYSHSMGSRCSLSQGEGIGGDDDVVLLRLLCKGRAGEPLVAVVDHGREGGGEALDFPVPVADDGHGADDERWAALGRVSIRRTVLTII